MYERGAGRTHTGLGGTGRGGKDGTGVYETEKVAIPKHWIGRRRIGPRRVHFGRERNMGGRLELKEWGGSCNGGFFNAGQGVARQYRSWLRRIGRACRDRTRETGQGLEW